MMNLDYDVLFRQAHSNKSLRQLKDIETRILGTSDCSCDGDKLRVELSVVRQYIKETEAGINRIKEFYRK